MLDFEVDHSGAWGDVTSNCPAPAEAGSLGSWCVRYVPSRPLPGGARLALARRWPSDWGIPQSANPAATDFFQVRVDGGGPARWWTTRMHRWHPFDHVLVVELLAPVQAGQRIELHYGDDSGDSPGARVQTFIEEASPLSVRLSPAGDSDWVEIAALAVEVVGGPAERVVATAPSRVGLGEAFVVHVRVEDRWGNPAGDFDGRFEIIGAASDPFVIRSQDGSVGRVTVVLQDAGLARLRVCQRGGDLVANVNPIDCSAEPAERLYWGDLHGQSLIGCGARSVTNYYRHARDFAGCDFASHQANCFLVSGPEWEETAAVSSELNRAGRFVTLLGVEWSAATRLGGDRNLYFPGDAAELRRCSHEFVSDHSDLDTDLPHADDLHAHYRGRDVVVALHVGGRTTDLRWHEPSLERLIEVHSTHATSEWFLLEALTRGYRMGVIAGSDGVDGRPGASFPGHMNVRNVGGGLTAVALPELSRAALLSGLRERRCYATTGERILLEFDCDGHPFGTEYATGTAPTINYRVEGTAPLAAVEIWRDTQVLHRAELAPGDASPSDTYRVSWRGTSAQGNWQRARMEWHGEARLAGASIVAARGHAFDTPDEGITSVEPGRVSWRSITAGDWDGIELDLAAERAPHATLAFAAGPMTLSTSLAALDRQPLVAEAQNPFRVVRIERLPVGLPAPGCVGTFTDNSPQSGCHAYWLRVLQHDGAMAWSSPVFVTREP